MFEMIHNTLDLLNLAVRHVLAGVTFKTCLLMIKDSALY